MFFERLIIVQLEGMAGPHHSGDNHYQFPVGYNTEVETKCAHAGQWDVQ